MAELTKVSADEAYYNYHFSKLAFVAVTPDYDTGVYPDWVFYELNNEYDSEHPECCPFVLPPPINVEQVSLIKTQCLVMETNKFSPPFYGSMNAHSHMLLCLQWLGEYNNVFGSIDTYLRLQQQACLSDIVNMLNFVYHRVPVQCAPLLQATIARATNDIYTATRPDEGYIVFIDNPIFDDCHLQYIADSITDPRACVLCVDYANYD